MEYEQAVVMKQCSECKLPKPVGEFRKDRTKADGLRSNCKKCTQAYNKAYEKAYGKAYRKAHPEYFKAYRKAYRAAHSEEEKARIKAWRAAHPEAVKACVKAWNDAHPEERKASEQRRRASKRLLDHSLTAAEWAFLLEAYDYCCAYCHKPQEEVGKLHQEHSLPLSRGGGYSIHNIVPACQHCNYSKGAKTPQEAGLELTRIELAQLSIFELVEE